MAMGSWCSRGSNEAGEREEQVEQVNRRLGDKGEQAKPGGQEERLNRGTEEKGEQVEQVNRGAVERGEQGADMNTEQGGSAKEIQSGDENPVEAPAGLWVSRINKSEENGQAFYAGGTESGQQVLGHRNTMFIEGSEGFRAFQGGGYRLGSDAVASSTVSVSGAKPEVRRFVVRMWKDRFSVDGMHFRRYENPANSKFLASVMRGSKPAELVRKAKGGEVHVDIEDHSEEEFVRQKLKPKPFQGSGNVLGSTPAPIVFPPQAFAEIANEAEAVAQAQLKVDSNAPLATIQVRMVDGSRLVVRLNHSHTVSDMAAYIRTARPQYEGLDFTMLTTFPNKELTDGRQTVAEAGLLGAAVLQRLK